MTSGKRGVVQRVAALISRARQLATLRNVTLLLCTIAVLTYMQMNNIILGPLGLVARTWLPIERSITQSQTFLDAWAVISPGSRATAEKARLYYESQLPYFERAAKEFEMHPYWARIQIDRMNMGWYEMITHRAKAMAKALEEEGRDDFRIEKDKCEMYRWFVKNGFLTAKIHGYWDNEDKFLDDIYNGRAVPEGSHWPVFFKCCHLTQGSSKSTKMIKSKEYLTSYKRSFTNFVREKWAYRANDWERPWATDMNKLTDSLTPGIMLQGPYPLSDDESSGWRKSTTVLELKIETFWGRAYLASVNFGRDTIILRDGSIEYYNSWWGNKFNVATESPYNTWIREEGHLERAWELAETAAKILGIEYVRIDVFIKKGDPDAIRINENSISSGMGYRNHFKYLPKIWASGHVNKWYSIYQTDLPVYQMSLPDGNHPNKKLLEGKTPPYAGTPGDLFTDLSGSNKV